MPSRKKVFCSMKCKHSWRKGKSLDEIYGDKAIKMYKCLNSKKPLHSKEWKDKARKRMLNNKHALGSKHSDSWKKKMGILHKGNTNGFKKGLIPWNKGRNCYSPESRLKMRESRLNYIEEKHGEGRIYPNIGRDEKKILDLFENNLNYHIERQYRVAGYFIDGFCRPLNLAIEIDEPAHRYKKKRD